MTYKYKWEIFGWVTTELKIELGIFETNMDLHDSWDIIQQIFDEDENCKEGLMARRIKQ